MGTHQTQTQPTGATTSSHELDQEFQDEFEGVVSDPSLPEADELFTPDVYDNTYLNMELALPRSGGKVELAWSCNQTAP